MLFDDDFPEEDQLPRRLEIEFRERMRGAQKTVILRCNGVNFGDRLTDNIEDPDWYRYHDIFHFAYMVHLGWSPVIRALLHCKRKSNAEIDEAQDGARAVILDEAVSATVFSHAKHLNFFAEIDHVDYDLLKLIRGFVDGYEVSQAPLWQWESAILDGYRVFRELRINRGGRVILDLKKREIDYITTA